MLNLKKNKKVYHRFATLTVVIAVIWLVMKPDFTIASIAICLIASGISAFLFTRVLRRGFSEKMIKILAGGLFLKKDFHRYLIFMVREIYTSTLHILKNAIVLKQFEDEIITITLPSHVSTYRIFLVVKSITITPGTSVIGVDGKTLTVHCLTKSSKNSLEEMRFINTILSFKF